MILNCLLMIPRQLPKAECNNFRSGSIFGPRYLSDHSTVYASVNTLKILKVSKAAEFEQILWVPLSVLESIRVILVLMPHCNVDRSECVNI